MSEVRAAPPEMPNRPRDERGTVTAESAVVLPLVAAFALTMVWLVSAGIAQVQVVDAARDAARAVARGESDAAASTMAAQTAPAGSEVSIDVAGSVASVTVEARAEPPGWLLVPLPAITVRSTAHVEVESDAAQP